MKITYVKSIFLSLFFILGACSMMDPSKREPSSSEDRHEHQRFLDKDYR
ncbi:MAG: hypothetical protein OXB88_09585 [Bacteriovoracales bacterium]|nr:hypothetical protein [Bacteriovoracales bacterium]